MNILKKYLILPFVNNGIDIDSDCLPCAAHRFDPLCKQHTFNPIPIHRCKTQMELSFPKGVDQRRKCYKTKETETDDHHEAQPSFGVKICSADYSFQSFPGLFWRTLPPSIPEGRDHCSQV